VADSGVLDRSGVDVVDPAVRGRAPDEVRDGVTQNGEIGAAGTRRECGWAYRHARPFSVSEKAQHVASFRGVEGSFARLIGRAAKELRT
jgi:hypothetical protein